MEIQTVNFDFKPFKTFTYLKCLGISSGCSLFMNLMVLFVHNSKTEDEEEHVEITETNFNDDLLKE